ncbi:Copper binding protein CusF [Thiohalomonas denitrificans]|uniref:Copper binding protein CusF n=2 Tax=Thiohalomonas denitrificans TaxID=415747 RepID=A0A1G5R0K3_9GAMM|nr:Copper binding protein CusF [Thiohalomonas denitrificans]
MSMNLKVADAEMLEGTATGDRVMFQLKRLPPQEYVIIEMKVEE